MYGFGVTPVAFELFPIVAEKMYKFEKLVLSNSITKADWDNTNVLGGNAIDQIRQIKNTPGKNILIVGSGTVISQLSNENLIDEYEFMMDPIAVGKGTVVFENVINSVSLKFKGSRVFKNVVQFC